MRFLKRCFFLIATSLIILFSINGCCLRCLDTPPVQKECPKTSAWMDSNTYILEINPKILVKRKESVTRKLEIQRIIREELAKKINVNQPVTDSVMEWCECGNLYLMKIHDPQIGPSDRVTSATTRTGASGDTAIIGGDYNYIFELDFATPLETIKEGKGHYNPSGTGGNFPVKIAVLDSGIDYGHNSLKDNIHKGNNSQRESSCFYNDEYGANFINRNELPLDYLGHGTHVAGIAVGKNTGATGNSQLDNSIGILNVKIFDKDTVSMFNAVCGMYYAMEMNAKVLNLSWGFYSPDTVKILDQVIRQAEEKQIFVVTAAGNNATNIDNCLHWPANFSGLYKNVFTIAAACENCSNKHHVDYSYSNYGKESVDFAALGTNVNSTFPIRDKQKILDGTSMAAPAVSRYIAQLYLQGYNYERILKLLNNLPGTRLDNAVGKMKQPVLLPQ